MYPWDNPENYKRTHKKKYTIEASMPPEGTVVFNVLENTMYKTSSEKQFVLTGTIGEQWVIDVNKLCKTYTFEDGTPINKESLSRKVVRGYKDNIPCPCIKPFKITSIPGVDNWAIHVPKQYVFQIPTAWGDVLTVNNPDQSHGKGDYIVCADAGGYPNLNDRWVVNGEIFADTYDMRAFPNMGASGPNYRSNDPHSHPEFKDVTWNSIHSMAYTAGKLHRDSKSNQEYFEVFKRIASEVCLNVHKLYPGQFGKPKASMDKKRIFIPDADKRFYQVKRGLEISFSLNDIGEPAQIDFTAHKGNSDRTQIGVGYTLDNVDIDNIMRDIDEIIHKAGILN